MLKNTILTLVLLFSPSVFAEVRVASIKETTNVIETTFAPNSEKPFDFKRVNLVLHKGLKFTDDIRKLNTDKSKIEREYKGTSSGPRDISKSKALKYAKDIKDIEDKKLKMVENYIKSKHLDTIPYPPTPTGLGNPTINY